MLPTRQIVLCAVVLLCVGLSKAEADGADPEVVDADGEVSVEEAVAGLRKQISGMGKAFRGAAGDASTPSMQAILRIAKECEAAVEKADALEDIDAKHQVLSEALERRGEWLAEISKVTEEATKRHKKEEQEENFQKAIHSKEL